MKINTKLMIAALALAILGTAKAAAMHMEVRLACGSMTGVGHIIVILDGIASTPIRLDCGKEV